MSSASLAGSGAFFESENRSDWSKGCGSCCSTYGSAAWAALPLAFSLATTVVQAHLTVPAAWTVDVRRCRCGAMIAARRGTFAAPP